MQSPTPVYCDNGTAAGIAKSWTLSILKKTFAIELCPQWKIQAPHLACNLILGQCLHAYVEKDVVP